MIILANDANVPAFTVQGHRDCVTLQAGTELEIVRPVDAINSLCVLRVNARELNVIVPTKLLKRADYEAFLDLLTQPNEEDEDSESEDSEQSVEHTNPMLAATLARLAPSGIGSFVFNPEINQREKISYVLPSTHRFILIESPFMRVYGGGKQKKGKTGLTREQIRIREAQARAVEKMKEIGLIREISQVQIGKSVGSQRWYVLPIMLDKEAGASYITQSRADAEDKAQAILAKEQEAQAPEYQPIAYGFWVRKTMDGDTAKYHIVSKADDPTLLVDQSFSSIAEAQQYVLRNLKTLMGENV
jgi:hypothetical protein